MAETPRADDMPEMVPDWKTRAKRIKVQALGWNQHLDGVKEAIEQAFRDGVLAERSRTAAAGGQEAELASLVALYYRREIGRLMRQAEHWAKNGKPLAVHHRVNAADCYYQIVVLMERDPAKGWQRPFDAIREAIARPLAEQEMGAYPPSAEISAYHDARYAVERLESVGRSCTEATPRERTIEQRAWAIINEEGPAWANWYWREHPKSQETEHALRKSMAHYCVVAALKASDAAPAARSRTAEPSAAAVGFHPETTLRADEWFRDNIGCLDDIEGLAYASVAISKSLEALIASAEAAAREAAIRECADAIAPPYFLNAGGVEAGKLYKERILSLLKTGETT